MKNLLVLLFCMFSIHSFSQSLNSLDSNGKKQGYWELKYKNGNYKYQGNFEEGIPVGKMKRFYQTGILKANMFFSDNGENVKCKLYNDKGQLGAEGNYLKSKKQGLWIIYDSKKNIKAKENYLNDERNGECQYFYSNGTPSFKINYSKGKKDGLYERFYENGNTLSEVNYKEGKLHGFYNAFYANGKLEIAGAFNKDIKYGEWIYMTSNAILKRKIVYDQDGRASNQSELDKQEQIEIKRLESNKDKFKDPSVNAFMY